MIVNWMANNKTVVAFICGVLLAIPVGWIADWIGFPWWAQIAIMVFAGAIGGQLSMFLPGQRGGK